MSSQRDDSLIRRPIEAIRFFIGSSFNQPPLIFSCALSRRAEQMAEARVPFDPSSLTSHAARYRSKDGTEIPISLVTKSGKLPLARYQHS